MRNRPVVSLRSPSKHGDCVGEEGCPHTLDRPLHPGSAHVLGADPSCTRGWWRGMGLHRTSNRLSEYPCSNIIYYIFGPVSYIELN